MKPALPDECPGPCYPILTPAEFARMLARGTLPPHYIVRPDLVGGEVIRKLPDWESKMTGGHNGNHQ